MEENYTKLAVQAHLPTVDEVRNMSVRPHDQRMISRLGSIAKNIRRAARKGYFSLSYTIQNDDEIGHAVNTTLREFGYSVKYDGMLPGNASAYVVSWAPKEAD